MEALSSADSGRIWEEKANAKIVEMSDGSYGRVDEGR
jgi:hypothetical protein